jgi:hypothetical protein
MKSAPLMNEDISLKQDMKEMPHFVRYDEGLKEFIKNFFIGDVIITPVDQFWEFYIKNTKHDLKFPAVSLFPTRYQINNSQNNFSSMQLGTFIQDAVEIRDEGTNKLEGTTKYLSKAARTLYMDIDYQINIWAIRREDALQLVQELMFPLFQHKEYQISYFNEKYSVPYTIDTSINDSSAIGADQGTMYIYSFNITVTAPIFDSKNYYNAINKDLKLFTTLGEEKL